MHLAGGIQYKGTYLLNFEVYRPELPEDKHLKKVSSTLIAGIAGETGIQILKLKFNIDWIFQPEDKEADTLDLLQAFVLNNCNLFNEYYKRLGDNDAITLNDMYSDYDNFKLDAERLLVLLYA